MAEAVKGIPDSSSVVIPRLFCAEVAAEIDFCKSTFGAVELGRRLGSDGKAAHALMTIGPAMIMIEAEWPGLASRAPKLDGSSPVVIYVYVEDVDKTVERAVAGGAKVLFPVQNQFWGDRIGWVMDPSGHVWTVATRIEETTEGERDGRWSAIMAGSDPDAPADCS
jgi:PhnB protein